MPLSASFSGRGAPPPRLRVPFNERGGPLRGLVDLAAGRYPAFLFGGSLDGYLPVFHFHEVSVDWLEPRFRFLAENGYRTVGSDAIARLVRDGVHPGPRRVALCFDDAWASLWTVAGPLLKRYGLTAITYVISGRVSDAAGVRPTMDEDAAAAALADRSDQPFATWPELKALHDAGLVDVQSHTHSHAMIFCGDRITGVVGPEYATTPLLSRPLVSTSVPNRFQDPADLGAPLFLQRSRMSDARRFVPAGEVRTRTIGAQVAGHFETADDQRQAILDELARSRATIDAHLGIGTVDHICLPWGVAGDVTLAALAATGYRTAFSNQMPGSYAVRAGDPPYRLKRLNSKHLLRLPRAGRSWWTLGRS